MLRALEEPAAVADRVAALEPEAVAVCLLHAYRHPAHEQALGAALRERLPGVHVSLSHEVVGTFREFERAATTELDAALSPLLAAYLTALAERAAGADLPAPDVMQSSGGLATLDQARAHAALTVLSGPAGGAAGAAWAALASGERGRALLRHGRHVMRRLRDRGGRRARDRGPPRRRPPRGAADARPAHGRRRRRFDRLARRGRRAARRAALGRRATRPCRLRARRDRADGHGRERRCSGCSARRPRWPARSPWTRQRPPHAIERLADELDLEPLACAEGIRRVANAEMIRALRVMTVERGVDPRGLALLAFGGAGPLHAAAIAEELGMSRILCPRASGVLAALGLVVSDRRRDAQRSVLLSGTALTAAALRDEIAALGERAGPGAKRVTAELRYRGQSFELAVDCGEEPEPDALREAFAAAHERAYGYRDEDGEVELVTLRVTATEPGPEHRRRRGGRRRARRGAIDAARLVRRRGARGRGAHRRAGAGHGAVRARDLRAARGDARSAARLGRPRRAVGHDPAGARVSVDPVTLRVVSGALRAACEEMGAVLIRAAHSANIKERRDASCALFDPAGRMVMQAEHIPVHLGAMPAAVEAVAGEDARAGRRLGAQRPLPRRHPPARHHRDHARRSPPTARSSASPPAARTTPTSAARRPARCPRTRPRSPTRAS